MSDGLGQTIAENRLIEEIESLLRDYGWMAREIERLKRCLYGNSVLERSWGVAQYGIDAAMPKGSSGKSQVELAAMDDREERLYNRIKKLSQKVNVVESAAEHIKGEMHKVVCDCMLEGMSYRSISTHLGVSRNKIRQFKDDIINQLCQNDQIKQVLKF